MTRTGAPTPLFRNLKTADRTVPGRHILGVVRFSSESSDPGTDAGYPSLGVHMTETEDEGFAEVWTSDRPVSAGRSGALSFAHDGGLLFCAARIPELPDYAEATEAVYSEALQLAETLGYPQIFRIWHYISRLNEDNAAGLEVYREFCAGRARALENRGRAGDMPAATVVGSHGGGIILYFLACNDSVQVNIDNPRQVPPYHYPSRYGPKAPNFARATFLERQGSAQVYVSGTAGILGHRTMHPGDVRAQCRLALDNIAYVLGGANLSVHGVERGSALHDMRGIKVYVRRQADIAGVQQVCQEAFAPSADIVFLHADICRSDLLVEIEGIATGDRVLRARSGDAEEAGALSPSEWEGLPAVQQPQWSRHPAFPRVRDSLRGAPPLVLPSELQELRAQLAAVALGSARVLQAGDCAESFYESTPEHTHRKIGALERLAERLAVRAGQPVVRIGRLGGQYAKPRSHPLETVDGIEIPAFRGHMVNAEGASPEARAHDPRRLLWAHHFSAEVLAALREERAGRPLGPWSSHDALLVDYLGPMLRLDPATGGRYLGSTHLPWIGERTGAVDGAQVALLAQVSNPVACKVGPNSTPDGVLRLCAALDPRREPGRLTLIVRMGRERIGALLPPIARAVQDTGRSMVWLSDPMHGNTLRLSSGGKVRRLDDMVAEAADCRTLLEGLGEHFGGLHLETAAEDVTECLGGAVVTEADQRERYTSLCDPRLNPEQAAELIDRVF
ncbi:FkbO/Hyg5 family chorismatase [Streptacidiphilus sp. EB103A]|uniref:FkbO/Hyg5 family chorismatase n=1 Tax=Streptacidiphilus sp. EB103A TaxID=3156275 RepID=UPI0035119012